MRYLNETDEAPTKMVKVIGDMCGIVIYTAIVGLVAVRRAALRKAKRGSPAMRQGGSPPTWRNCFTLPVVVDQQVNVETK
jgi:hypothetical protein